MMTRKVGAAERPTVTKLTARYKQFCEQRGQLSELESQIQDHLNQYEAALIKQAQRPLGFVTPKPSKTAKTKSTLQTRRTRQN